jgi:3-oxoacyl-[acyl-carrier-protein] synthase-3
MRSKISHIANFSPDRIVSSKEVEDKVNSYGDFLPYGVLEQKFGVKERRYAEDNDQCSDLAVGAGLKIIEKVGRDGIDCLIFASGGTDLIEPATCNIVQSKLSLSCPAIDVKNACNSFVCGLQIADSFIKSGTYKKILVVAGEKVSTIIKYDPVDKIDLINRMAGLSMGDAGAAALVEASNDDAGLYAQTFKTYGEHWNLCTIPGGGTMYPRDPSKVYFEGQTRVLRDVFLSKGFSIFSDTLKEVNWSLGDIDHFFMHHVAASTFEMIALGIGVDPGKFYNVIDRHGNMAAASIPFAIACAEEEGVLKKGDKIMIIGLASGISISIQLMIW